MKKSNLVLIILFVIILGMIVISNYQEAQTRFKVARCKGEMLTTATALEAYYVDHHCYPGEVPLKNFSIRPDHDFEKATSWLDLEFSVLEKAYGDKLSSIDPGLTHPGVAGLTTPVAYLPKLPVDPFINFRGEQGIPYAYHVYPNPPDTDYLLWSPGPDKTYDITHPAELYDPDEKSFSTRLFLMGWEPNYYETNNGDIWRIKKAHEAWLQRWVN